MLKKIKQYFKRRKHKPPVPKVAMYISTHGEHPKDVVVNGLVFTPKFMYNASFKFPSSRYHMKLNQEKSACSNCGTIGRVDFYSNVRYHGCQVCEDILSVSVEDKCYKVIGKSNNKLQQFLVRLGIKLKRMICRS